MATPPGDGGWEGLCRRHRIRYLVLFGSRASGRVDGLSDWDIAARLGRRPSTRELLELIADIVELLGDERVDLLVLDRPGLPPALLYEVLWRGRPLCILDREAYLWDRVRALALYQEYRLVFRQRLLAVVEALAKRGAREEG